MLSVSKSMTTLLAVASFGALFVQSPAEACHRRRYICRVAPPVYVYPSCTVVHRVHTPTVVQTPTVERNYEHPTPEQVAKPDLAPADAIAQGTQAYLNSQYDEAIRLYSLAIEADPKNAAAFKWRGVVQSNRVGTPNYSGAIADLERAVALAPKDAEAHGYLALIYGACPQRSFRNGTEAVKHATKACELTDWQNPEFLIALATAHAQAGQFENAVKRAEQAIDVAESASKESMKVVLAQFQRQEAIP